MINIESIFAVIVLYNISYKDAVTVKCINEALELTDNYLDVLIYDNSFVSVEARANFSYKRLNIHYIHDCSNSGVSRAYNIGAQCARDTLYKKWILLFDQDTIFPKDLFLKYIKAISEHKEIKLFAPILMAGRDIVFSPCKYYFGRGFALKKVSSGITSFKSISPVNSGMLINLEEFFRAGMFNEKVRLDFSDFQFIERFRRIESNFYVVDIVGRQDFSNYEVDCHKLNIRYAFFCEGAKNFDKENIIDEIKYLVVAFMRAATLSFRTKSFIFYKTFFNSYVKS